MFATMLRRAIPLLACFALGTSGIPAGAQEAPAYDGPSAGTICIWAIYSAMEQIGQRCFAGQDPELQAAVSESVGRLDRYVRANTRISDEEVATFKREQAMVGAPREQICHSEVTQMYASMRKLSVARIRGEIDKVVARTDPPVWGDCL